MGSSKHSPSVSLGPVIEAEWRPIPPEEDQPHVESPSEAQVIVARLKRRADVRAQTAAPVTASGRCLVCGDATSIRAIRVGPWRVRLCGIHSTAVNVAAFALRRLIG